MGYGMGDHGNPPWDQPEASGPAQADPREKIAEAIYDEVRQVAGMMFPFVDTGERTKAAFRRAADLALAAAVRTQEPGTNQRAFTHRDHERVAALLRRHDLERIERQPYHEPSWAATADAVLEVLASGDEPDGV